MRESTILQVVSLLFLLLFTGQIILEDANGNDVTQFFIPCINFLYGALLLLLTFICYRLRNNKLSKSLAEEKNYNNKLLLHKRASQKLTKILRPALENQCLYTSQDELHNKNIDHLICIDNNAEESFEIKSLFRLVKRYFYNLSFKCRYDVNNSIIKVPFSLAFAYQIIFSILDQIEREISKDQVIECVVTRSNKKIQVSFVYKIDKYLCNQNFQRTVPSYPLFISNIVDNYIIKQKPEVKIMKYVSDHKHQIDLLINEAI